MKKSLLCAAILCPMLHFAQTNKGNMFIGGNLGINSSNTKYNYAASATGQETSYKYSYISVAPTFGYFVADNFAVGIGLNFNQNKSVSSYTPNSPFTKQSYTNQSSQISLFARKYIPVSDVFKFFAGFSVNAGLSKYKYEYTGSTQQNYTNKGSQAYAGFDLGFAYFPVKQIGLHASIGNLGWTHYKYKIDSNNASNSNGNTQNNLAFGLNTASFNFGLAYFFGMN